MGLWRRRGCHGPYDHRGAGAAARARAVLRAARPAGCPSSARALKASGAVPGVHDESVDVFVEVPGDFITEKVWKVTAARRWKKPDKIHLLEGQALSWAVRRVARNVGHHHHRYLVLSDNMSVVCAVGKGRAKDRELLQTCRVIRAVSLACDLRIYVRWIPSEVNPSDPPSRRFQPRSRYQHEGEHRESAPGSAACVAPPVERARVGLAV